MNAKTTVPPVSDEVSQVVELQQALAQAKERERRSLADYQNLVKRTSETQARMVKFASRELVSALLQPLEHLDLAALQLKDKGLDMVIQQLWQQLELAGLEEIKVAGQAFDPQTMEVVEAGANRDKVIKVVKKGYRLHGEVIQHAKVILD